VIFGKKLKKITEIRTIIKRFCLYNEAGKRCLLIRPARTNQGHARGRHDLVLVLKITGRTHLKKGLRAGVDKVLVLICENERQAVGIFFINTGFIL
jgi:hypothetical protein